MRAVIARDFGPPDNLVVEEIEPPIAGPGEVVVEVRAAGVNYPDLLVVGGQYQLLPPLPFSPGKEVAGVVAETGAGVTDLRAGDRVLAQLEHGGYREAVAVPAAHCVRLPRGMPEEEAAAFGLCHLTAHAGLIRRGRFAAGETVLVTGVGGGVGSAAVSLAKALGARVIAAARDEERREYALRLGADHAVLADPETLRDQVRSRTEGHDADIVLETVGGEVFDACLRCVAWEGRLVVIGFATGRIPSTHAGYLLVKNIGVLGLQVSDYRDREPATMRAALREMLDMWASGLLRVDIAEAYPLGDAAKALTRVATGGLTGRVVLTVDAPESPRTGAESG